MRKREQNKKRRTAAASVAVSVTAPAVPGRMYATSRLIAVPIAVLIAALVTTLFVSAALSPAWASVPRFGVDQQNSRQITDSLEETGFPFQKKWQTDLGGEVESQPIVRDGRIYVQAGDCLVMLDMDGAILARSPSLSDCPMPSGSSPTYAETVYGDRLYQATRDHRLWALDPDTLQSIWVDGFFTISAGDKPDLLYRVTASPLVISEGGRTWLSLGTGNGDQTGRPGQYADNGFFILEDRGSHCELVYSRQAAGEVTGSPLQSKELVVATQNIVTGSSDEENMLLIYDLHEQKELENMPTTPRGIPGSPAADNFHIYVADRQGSMYCYEKKDKDLTLLWKTPPPGGGSSYNLNSPTIGGRYVYLPIRQYRGGGGLLAAYEKSTGIIEKMLAFDNLLCSNVVYWKPDGSEREFLLVYEASGRTQLLDAVTLEAVKGFMDSEGNIQKEIMLPHAPGGVKAPEPIIGENHILLADGAGVLHAYLGRGPDLDEETDLAVIDFQAPDTVLTGEKAQWRAKVINLSEEPVEQAVVAWLENGKIVHTGYLDLAGGESADVSFAWQGTDRPGNVRAEVSVSPPDPMVDTDESNNTLWRYIAVIQAPVRVNCAEVRDKGSWTVTYAVLTGYQIRSYRSYYINSEGGTSYTTRYYTDYNSPIYKYTNVGYTENLSTNVTVYTGQGRLPDPARPAQEDREGRGAWEIIPYARSRGLDPNLVTRAGAGFSIRVETNYTTDWETKVPAKATAIGGTLAGPVKVTAEFYDTRGKMVKSIALERTSGAAGPGKAVWELPVSRHTYLDGTTETKRWFYTAPDIPDGVYQVLVRAEGAGLHLLYTCEVATVRIYGSIYDDIYEKITP